jgi:hypothetical protein
MEVNSDMSNQTQLHALEEVFAPLIANAKMERSQTEGISQMSAVEAETPEVGNNKKKKSEDTDNLKSKKFRPNQDIANETMRVINQGVEKSPELFLQWFGKAAPLLMDGIVNKTSVEEFQAFETEFMPTMKASYAELGQEYTSPKIVNSDKGMKEAPSIFTQWTSDALTLFMFDTAPLLQILNFMLRQTLSDAQVAMTEAQLANAQTAKELTIAKGESEAQKCIDQAVSSFMSGGLGLLQTGASFKDNLISQDTFQNDLAHTDNTIELMNEGRTPAAREATAGGTVDATDPAVLSADKETARRLAKEYKQTYDTKLSELSAPDASPLAYEGGHTSSLGLNQAPELVAQKKTLEARKQASTYAMDELGKKLDGSYYDGQDGRAVMRADQEAGHANFGEKLLHNPDVAGAFMDELHFQAGGTAKMDGMLSGKSPEVKLGGQGAAFNIKHDLLRSFGKSETKPYVRKADGSIKMEPKMTTDNQGQSIRALDENMQSVSEPVIDHGKKATAEIFKEEMEARRGLKDSKAHREYNEIETNRIKRQVMAQMIQGFADGGTQVDAAAQSKKIAENEAGARISETLAANFASAREALAGAISGAYERVQGFDAWYNQMLGQLTGALSQSFA